MEDAVLYRLPFDSTCLLFFSIRAYGWHSDTRAMFFSPRCWIQYRKSLFCVPTHTPEYDHLYFYWVTEINLHLFVVTWCWKYQACFSMAQAPWRSLRPQFPLGSYNQGVMPLCLLPETFSNQSHFLPFPVLKRLLHLSLPGKKNKRVLSTLLEKTSGSPWRRRSTPLLCSTHHVS